jgi:hypothetical protein
MFNNLTPTFTKPDTFTFENNIVINCLLTKKLPRIEIHELSHKSGAIGELGYFAKYGKMLT